MRLPRPGPLAIALAVLSVTPAAAAGAPACDAGNGGLTLPHGFCALVVADDLGGARHLTVRDNGDLFVAMNGPARGAGIVALRDEDDDGRADREQRFHKEGGTGIAVMNGSLYFASDSEVVRYPLPEGDALVPTAKPETVVGGFPEQDEHTAKSIAFDDRGGLFVNVGAPSNACQKGGRRPGAPGRDPCPELERHAGIWRFDATRPGQRPADGTRVATGIRNAVALAWNPASHGLYAVQHGRDQLHDLWPDLFTERQSTDLPAEEFLRLEEGANFGWPYCYFDPVRKARVLGPEYGGDGRKVGRCADFARPAMAFPAHWAPNALLFYSGRGFPARYRNGAFIAFHGSWNRTPVQAGYKVVFVPFAEGRPAGDDEVFADGFAGSAVLESPGDAEFRPVGLAQGADGDLYISDSVRGRIWRVTYKGD